MRTFAALLLASTCLLASPALAAEEADAPAADVATDDSTIFVFGEGQTRQVQEIDNKEITILTPGTSPLKAIEKLPSVNVQNADPFGAYEWSQRVSIRSFYQSQLGHNLDGIPLGSMQYGNFNGLHLSRAVSPENVGSVQVSQGAGNLGAQSTNNLGGSIESFTLDPDPEFAATASATYGSDETMRGFVRVNAGTPDGVRGYISYGYGSTDKWRGEGKQTSSVINAKVVVPVGTAEIAGYVSYSDRREQDYQDMSLGMIDRLGWDWDNFFSDYDLAVLVADIANNIDNVNNSTGAPGADGLSDITGYAPTNPAAGTVFPGNITNADDAYYDASGLRKDTLAALGLTLPLGDNGSFHIKGYYHHDDGVGTWATPYVQTASAPLTMRTTEYDIDRGGVFGSFNFEIGANEITIGGWYEHNDFNQARRFYAMPSRTEALDFREFPKNPYRTDWEFDYITDTLQYHVEDRITLGDVTVNVGWKGYSVENEARAIVAGPYPEGTLKVEDWFQPHVGFAWDLTDQAQLFGGYTQVTRAFESVNGGPFGTTAAAFELFKDDLKPEKSETYEIGLRYNSGPFKGVVGAYYVEFANRLLSIKTGSDIQGNPTILQNVGSVETWGLEAAGDLALGNGFGIYASYSYISAEYADDVINQSGDLLAATKGKTAVDVPAHMANLELTYDNDTGLFGRIGLDYMSKRYYSYLNDASVPGRVLLEATLGYRITENIEVQLNGTNLTDKKYIGTVGSAGWGNSGDNQTLLIGAPRQVFATLRFNY